MRRLLLTAALAAGALVLVRATFAVTFILTTGARVSGDIASTSEASPTMPNGELNLEMLNGDERSFGQEMVAVIDYASGRPSDEELRALPARGHMLALRNGSTEPGRMVGLRRDTLRWSGASGRIEEIATSAVSRIYLDPDAARKVFDFSPAPDRPGRGGQNVTPSGGPQPDGSVFVVANQAYTDSGMTVRVGENLRFQVSGQIKFGLGESQTAPADGNDEVRNPRFPVPSLPVGGLIGRVGRSAPFSIGSAPRPIRMPETGRLMLGVNDTDFGDNSGYFRVVIARVR